jgi:hypothetical protein
MNGKPHPLKFIHYGWQAHIASDRVKTPLFYGKVVDE